MALRPISRSSSRRTVEELLAHIERLTARRQQLRAEQAPPGELERNRLDIAGAQWELSYALIDRYLPAA